MEEKGRHKSWINEGDDHRVDHHHSSSLSIQK